MPETYEAPTAAEIAEHLEKGGKVEVWTVTQQAWGTRWGYPAAWWRRQYHQNTPQPGVRLVPLPPPRTVTVELPEDVARELTRLFGLDRRDADGYHTEYCVCGAHSGRAWRDHDHHGQGDCPLPKLAAAITGALATLAPSEQSARHPLGCGTYTETAQEG